MKMNYLAAMSALLIGCCTVSLASCSLDEPENPVPDGVTVNPDGDADKPNITNPFTNYKLNSLSCNSYGEGILRSLNIAYTTKTSTNVETIRADYNQDVSELWTVTYGENGTPTSIVATYEDPNWYYESDPTAVVSETYDNLTFEDGLLKSATLSRTTADKTVTTDIAATYTYNDKKQLTQYSIGSDTYKMTWNEDGDLLSAETPKDGKVTYTYSKTKNHFGQWDPMMRFVGFMQITGWFGVAPAHYPSNMSFKPEGSQSYKQYDINYLLNDYKISQREESKGSEDISWYFSYENKN